MPSARVRFVSFESLGVIRLEPELPEDITAVSYTLHDAAIDAESEAVSIEAEQLAEGSAEWYVDLYSFWMKFSDRYTDGITMDVWIDIHLTHADGTVETIRTRCDEQKYAFWSNYNPYASFVEMYINFSPDDPVPEIHVSEDSSQVTKTRFHVWLYGADFDPEGVSIQVNENYIAVRFPVENPADEVETHLWLRLQGSDELYDYKEIVPIHREEGVS